MLLIATHHSSLKHYLLWLTLLALLIFSQQSFAAEKVGVISFARGTVAATLVNEQPRLLGKDAVVFQGDNIQTSERSFVIIDFNDGTKITVRPNSSFSVDKFSVQEQSAKLTVHKGGIRTSSGDIASKSTDNFEITTPHTTIKAQQAEFSVRVCEAENCQKEEEQLADKKSLETTQQVVARVVELKGDVTAVKEDDLSQDPRLLHVGAPLYQSDKLISELGGFAVIVFRDHGRITIDPDSSFKIASYQLNNAKAADNAAFDLLTGAMRVLTGTIGKENKEAFSVNTPVATIGIRGTGFDLIFQREGLYAKVWQGAIFERNEAGTFELTTPNANLIKDKNSKPIPLPELPESLANMKGPRPDQVTVENEPELFKVVPLSGTEAGTFVDVHSGHVQVMNNQGLFIDLGAGETSYTNLKGETIRIITPPKMMQYDPYPLPSDSFNENTAEVTTFSLLNDNMTLSASGDVLQCECK